MNEQKEEKDKKNEKTASASKKRKSENSAVVMMTSDSSNEKADDFISNVVMQFGESLQAKAVDLQNQMNEKFDTFTFALTNAMTSAITASMSSMTTSLQNTIQAALVSSQKPSVGQFSSKLPKKYQRVQPRYDDEASESSNE